MLQNKYSKLRKKKNALQLMKTPRQESEPANPVKRPFEAKNAKEFAKKLIRSGAIRSIEKRDEKKVKKNFKRSKGLERKMSGSDRAVSSYQPFSAIHALDSAAALTSEGDKAYRAAGKSKSLYDVYASARDQQERRVSRDCSSVTTGPGHTVYVHGLGLTEQLLKQFCQPFGTVVNISMEIEKHCGFVTFDKVESAQRAVSELNNASIQDVQLQASYARRQPKVEPINDATVSSAWSTIAASHSQKGVSHDEQRNLLVYDDVFS